MTVRANKWRAIRNELFEILVCASDMARTKRGGLGDTIHELGWYNYDLYSAGRRALNFVENQLGYEVWTEWGDELEPHLQTNGRILYADALLEAAYAVRDHWRSIADHIILEDKAIRELREEVRALKNLVESHGLNRDGTQTLYTGLGSLG